METCANSVDDIEDLGALLDGTGAAGSNGDDGKVVQRKRVGRNGTWQLEPVVADSFIPGTHTVYVKTWGCTHNTSDGEYMSGLLAAAGYALTPQPELADVWVLNSCTVKGPAEDHFRNTVEAGMKKGKRVVVSGCVPQASPKSSYLRGLSVVGVQQIDRVVEVVEETLKGHTVRLLGPKKEGGRKTGGPSLLLPKIRKNPLVEIVPISTGCLNQCTYCKTKHARGDLGSYGIDDIVARAREAFRDGAREVWLTSEDTGAYGRDVGASLPDLLRRLVDVVPDGCMIRVGMTNPPYILEHLEDMAVILSHPRVYAFLHVPVQSGSDAVLADMKREYCIADFKKVVDFLRERVPGITIATDIICGFPTETEEDFEYTLQLVEQYKFPSLFINQFYPRPGTPAARMKRVPTDEVKRRTKRLTELFGSYRPYDHKCGVEETVLVTDVSHDGLHYVGHNKSYQQVLVPKDSTYLGQTVEVTIVEAGKHHLVGRPSRICESAVADVPRPGMRVSAMPLLRSVSNCVKLCCRTCSLPTVWVWACSITFVVAVLLRLHTSVWGT